MTIQARDIGELFAVMRASYGHLWPHSSDDVPVWLQRLGGYSRAAIMDAAESAPRKYPDHPPTLGQFEVSVSGTVIGDWVRATMIEDQRPKGRMSYADWKKANGVT